MKQDWEITDYEQKFKIGNVVEYNGKKAIIEYSYFDKFGGNNKGNKSIYCIIECEDGHSHAWNDEKYLKFIEEGGEHLIEQAKIIYEKRKQLETSLKYIIDNFKDGQNSNQILYLFDRIGYVPIAFINEGSYIHLMSDWYKLRKIFVYIICLGNKYKQEFEEYIKSMSFLNCEKVMILFDEVKVIQTPNA
jgi:hypothetical protein